MLKYLTPGVVLDPEELADVDFAILEVHSAEEEAGRAVGVLTASVGLEGAFLSCCYCCCCCYCRFRLEQSVAFENE